VWAFKHALTGDKEQKFMLNMEKLKQRYNDLQNKNSGGSKYLKLPENGTAVIRLVPTPDGDPFRSYYVHYRVLDKGSVLCPKRNFGDKCAICDFTSKLYNEGSDESKKEASKIVAKQRFFSIAVKRGEEEDGVKYWGYSPTVYAELMGYFMDPDYGDLSHPDTGTDLTIKRYKDGGSYLKTKATPKRKSTPVSVDDKIRGKILDFEPDFESLNVRRTSDEVATILDEYLLGSNSESEGGDEPETQNIPMDQPQSVEDTFKDLLGA